MLFELNATCSVSFSLKPGLHRRVGQMAGQSFVLLSGGSPCCSPAWASAVRTFWSKA